MEQEPTYVSIDVAKARVDVAVRPSGDNWSIDYDETGVAGLVDRLQAMRPAAVLLEATGGLEVPLASALAAAALPVVVNPRQVSMPNTNGSVDEPRRPATSSNSARLSCSGDHWARLSTW